jgi:hypothetical protein
VKKARRVRKFFEQYPEFNTTEGRARFIISTRELILHHEITKIKDQADASKDAAASVMPATD